MHRALAGTLLALGHVWAQNRPPSVSPERAAFVAIHDYLSRDGGRWRAPNSAFQPGSPQPKFWGLEFRWVANKAAVHSRILGIRENGSVEEFWAMFNAWDPGKNKGIHIQVHNGGGYVDGEFETLKPDFSQITLHGRNPDGAKFVLRETMRLLSPDGVETSSAYLADGKWQMPNRTTWKRVETFDAR